MPLGTPAPEHGARDAKTVVNVWQLGRHAEGVRQIANFHRLAKGQTVANAVHQISDNRLAGDKGGVRLGIPWPYEDPFFSDQLFQPGAIIRIDGEKVLHYRHLSVKVIAGVSGVLLQRVDDVRKII